MVALEESLSQSCTEQLKADGAKAGNLATPGRTKLNKDKLNKNPSGTTGKESKEKLEKFEAFTNGVNACGDHG